MKQVHYSEYASNERFLSPKEAMQRLCVGRTKYYQLLQSGAIPITKLGGRYYISENNLNKFIRFYSGKEVKI